MLAWTKMIRHGSKNAGMIGLTTAYRVAKLQVGSEADPDQWVVKFPLSPFLKNLNLRRQRR